MKKIFTIVHQFLTMTVNLWSVDCSGSSQLIIFDKEIIPAYEFRIAWLYTKFIHM